jgi:hypothetical protein
MSLALTGWGPNGRAWWDDEFWMDVVLGVEAALLAGIFGAGLYLLGQRSERRKGQQERRDAVADDIGEALLDIDDPVKKQMDDPEPNPEAVAAIRDVARRLTRTSQMQAGTALAALPSQLGAHLRQWANLAAWNPPTSLNRAPDLIDHAYQLSEYVDEVRNGLASWREGKDYRPPHLPAWEVARRERRAEQQGGRVRRMHGDDGSA